jgi:hypothetical protein
MSLNFLAGNKAIRVLRSALIAILSSLAVAPDLERSSSSEILNRSGESSASLTATSPCETARWLHAMDSQRKLKGGQNLERGAIGLRPKVEVLAKPAAYEGEFLAANGACSAGGTHFRP